MLNLILYALAILAAVGIIAGAIAAVAAPFLAIFDGCGKQERD